MKADLVYDILLYPVFPLLVIRFSIYGYPAVFRQKTIITTFVIEPIIRKNRKAKAALTA